MTRCATPNRLKIIVETTANQYLNETVKTLKFGLGMTSLWVRQIMFECLIDRSLKTVVSTLRPTFTQILRLLVGADVASGLTNYILTTH